jgi:hypothetical protein
MVKALRRGTEIFQGSYQGPTPLSGNCAMATAGSAGVTGPLMHPTKPTT